MALYCHHGKTIFPRVVLKAGVDANSLPHSYPADFDVVGYSSFLEPTDAAGIDRLLKSGDTKGMFEIPRSKREYETQ